MGSGGATAAGSSLDGDTFWVMSTSPRARTTTSPHIFVTKSMRLLKRQSSEISYLPCKQLFEGIYLISGHFRLRGVCPVRGELQPCSCCVPAPSWLCFLPDSGSEPELAWRGVGSPQSFTSFCQLVVWPVLGLITSFVHQIL